MCVLRKQASACRLYLKGFPGTPSVACFHYMMPNHETKWCFKYSVLSFTCLTITTGIAGDLERCCLLQAKFREEKRKSRESKASAKDGAAPDSEDEVARMFKGEIVVVLFFSIPNEFKTIINIYKSISRQQFLPVVV